MKVVILAGGFGTRLREVTRAMPKPMVEIGGHPILWHIMKHYSVFGFNDFIICLGYKGDMIRNYFLNYKWMNTDFKVELGTGNITAKDLLHNEKEWGVLLAETGLKTGTGGRIKRIQKHITNDTFLVTYGDSLSNVQIDRVIAHHNQMGLVATMCAMRSSQRFGVVKIDKGKVVKFEEKPKISSEWINGGFYVFNRRIFDYLDDNCTFEQEPLTRLVADDQLAVYQHEGIHRAMDTLQDMQSLNAEWESGKAPWKTWSD